MQVDERTWAVRVHHAAHAFHHRAVERDVVHIHAVDLVVLQHPAQAFQIIIDPARLGAGDPCGIGHAQTIFGIPGRPVVLH